MRVTNINSKNELIEKLASNKNSYVLIYKSGSEQSDCAFNNLKETEEVDDVSIYAVDVTTVKNIHTDYAVNTAPTLLQFENEKMIKQLKGCDKPDFYKSLFKNNLFVAKTADTEKPQKRVTVYSTPTCSWCTRLKKYFDDHNIKYRDIDVSKDTNAAEDMVKKSGQQGVPQTDINGQMIVGFDKPKINNLLGIKD